MNIILAWLKKVFQRQISTNPEYLDKTVNRFFLPAIFLVPLITLYLNFPGDPEISYNSKATVSYFNEPISPIPKNIYINLKKAEIGEILFNSKLLSTDRSISCSTCHTLETGGSNRISSADSLNPTSVYNAGIYIRSSDVTKDDISSLTVNYEILHFPKEMGDVNANLNNLINDTDLIKKIKIIYSNNPTFEIINDALAEFIISLYTPNSKFDNYLRGEKNSLSTEEKEGYQLFKELGCISCHQGVNIGGNLYQTVGITDDYFKDKGEIGDLDLGLYLKTQRVEDKYKFKVPSLRNIAVTYPYLHDGRYQTLKEVVSMMSKYQLGKQLNEGDTEKIILFLNTLTGEYKGQLLK